MKKRRVISLGGEIAMGESFAEYANSIGYGYDWDGDDAPQPPKHRSIKELSTEIEFKAFKELLVSGILGKAEYKVRIFNQWGNPFEAEYPVECFESITQPGVDSVQYYLTIQADISSGDSDILNIRSFCEYLHLSGLPLYYDSGGAVWNEEKNSVATFLEKRSIEFRSRYRPDYEQDGIYLNILRRAWLTFDHSAKPILFEKNETKNVIAGRGFHYISPNEITSEDYSSLSLAYINSIGRIEVAELAQFVGYNATISVRGNSYYFSGEHYRSVINYALLFSNAFLIAALHTPKKFLYFRKRIGGTIFQPAFEKLDVKPIIEYENSLDAAKIINEVTNEFGDVYITIGRHPLDMPTVVGDHNDLCLITTPKLYEYAIRKLENSS